MTPTVTATVTLTLSVPMRVTARIVATSSIEGDQGQSKRQSSDTVPAHRLAANSNNDLNTNLAKCVGISDNEHFEPTSDSPGQECPRTRQRCAAEHVVLDSLAQCGRAKAGDK